MQIDHYFGAEVLRHSQIQHPNLLSVREVRSSFTSSLHVFESEAEL